MAARRASRRSGQRNPGRSRSSRHLGPDRALIRTQASGRLAEAAVIELRVRLNGAATGWDILRLDAEVIERARRPFPREPLRTLDALHLASALVADRVAERATLLSLDGRVRVAGRELGLIVVPE